jgi:hypothetical protein
MAINSWQSPPGTGTHPSGVHVTPYSVSADTTPMPVPKSMPTATKITKSFFIAFSHPFMMDSLGIYVGYEIHYP